MDLQCNFLMTAPELLALYIDHLPFLLVHLCMIQALIVLLLRSRKEGLELLLYHVALKAHVLSYAINPYLSLIYVSARG